METKRKPTLQIALVALLAAASLCLLTLAGCGDPSEPDKSKLDSIPFREDQLYAVAYLGYDEINDLPFYAENYLDHENLPIHYLSKGDYYLVIPRYADMAVRLYQNDMQTMNASLLYEDMECRPFLIQCNVSDIFPDATISLTYQGETVEFSPYISLQDGSVQVGDRGLDITK